VFRLAKHIALRYIARVSKKTLEAAELRALADLRYELRKYLAFAEAEAARAGVEPKQYQLMLALAAMPAGEAATVGALAARLFVKHHSAVGLVDRLEANGLASRQRSASDGRQVIVSLTRAGTKLLGDLSLLHKEELTRIAPSLVTTLENIVGAASARRDRRKK
jgi:DNA-binding MarR family transcriptional regulator